MQNLTFKTKDEILTMSLVLHHHWPHLATVPAVASLRYEVVFSSLIIHLSHSFFPLEFNTNNLKTKNVKDTFLPTS